MPPTTVAPSVIAWSSRSRVPGSRRMPSWGKATICTSHRSACSCAARTTPRSGVRPPIVSTSTCVRMLVVPASTAWRMTTPARSLISSAVAARLVRCRISMASARVPVRFSPSSGSVPTLSRWMCGWTKAGPTSRPPTGSSTSPPPSTCVGDGSDDPVGDGDVHRPGAAGRPCSRAARGRTSGLPPRPPVTGSRVHSLRSAPDAGGGRRDRVDPRHQLPVRALISECRHTGAAVCMIPARGRPQYDDRGGSTRRARAREGQDR